MSGRPQDTSGAITGASSAGRENAMEKGLRQLHSEGEQGFASGVDGREEGVSGRSTRGRVSRVVSSFLELPQGLLRAPRVGCEFGEESLALRRGYPFEKAVVPTLARAGGEGHAKLACPLLQLIHQPQALSSAQGKVHWDVPHVAKGPCACVLLPKLIA